MEIKRIKIVIRGAVQGVGFRPFVYNLAKTLKLPGYVLNSSQGVFIEVEGKKDLLDRFLFEIEQNKPSLAIIQSLEFSVLDALGYKNFEIRSSSEKEDKTAFILPDIAVCNECLKEMFNPSDKRYLYPFINCTNCGPRYSIIEKLPYDRPNTSMKSFEMCDNCRKEYKDPGNRRFHAQPIACPECGPHIELWNENGSVLAGKQTALPESAYYLKMGKILAIKGLGGFQLLTDARKTECIERLRQRKRREEKPFALMFPSLDLIKKHCIVSLLEERILKSPEAPIVFLKRKNIPGISPEVAPDNPYLGIMLPYTPLHHLLLREIGFPVVATSANLSEDPMIYTDADALDKLKGIADFYLVHNRPIVRQVDDSIVRIIQDREMVMRRARGYAPLPVQINSETERELLAVGAHLKNTISIKKGKNIFISQHIGDLSSGDALKAFQNISGDMIDLYQIHNPLVVHDMHPDYLSTQQAKTKFKQTVEIQHHEAHVAACYAENQIDEEVLGVSWDGTGLGYDRNIWGGEFFRLSKKSISHIAQFQPFPLPGGDKAIKQPRRSLFGILYALYGKNISDKYNGLTTKFNKEEIKVLLQMLEKGINCPHTSSVGRIFDAVSSMLGIKDKINFEGQAAIMLEYLCDDDSEQTFPFVVEQNKLQSTINWKPMVESIIENITEDKPVRLIASKFHNTLAEIIVQVAEFNNLNKVIMSGGCFQNKILLERTIKRLRTAGMKAYWHQRIPTNDGGISLGQIVAAELWYNK